MRKGSVAIAFVLIGCAFFGPSLFPNAKAGTLYVGGSGPGNYTTIQGAIDVASAGDTVFVFSGLYYEHLQISKSILLTGEDRDSTIVDGFKTGTVVHVDGGEATITNLTITNGSQGSGDAGIEVRSSLNVRRSRILDNAYGIHVRYSGGSTFVDNLIHGNTLYGIVSGSSRNVIFNNTIVDNGGGIQLGGIVSANNIKGNIISSNIGDGISMVGLLGISPSRNTVEGNTISDNGYGIYLYNAWGNFVENNNIINNDNQAFVRSDDHDWCVGNDWDYNYWSDYNGTDKNGDGIGDTGYSIDCTDALLNHHPWDNYDFHPRMIPIGPIYIDNIELDAAFLSDRRPQDVHVTWSVSPGNLTVIGFRIYRGSTFDADGSGYGLIAFLSSGYSAYTHKGGGEGNPGMYFYRVCALDIHNNEICAKNQAAKFARSLGAGPNLISVPVVGDNESVGNVLKTVRFNIAWFFDSFGQKWISYSRFKTYDSLRNVNRSMGIWINVTRESNLTVAGLVPDQTTIHLERGWNMVGFPSFDPSITLADIKSAIGDSAKCVERVDTFDESAPPHFLRTLEETDTFLAGQGYWIKVSSSSSWVVSNP